MTDTDQTVTITRTGAGAADAARPSAGGGRAIGVATEHAAAGSSERRATRLRAAGGLGGTVLVVGLLITGTLTWAAWTVNSRNESRLLGLQVKEAGSLLAEVAPIVQTPLTSAVELASSTDGNASQFIKLVTPEVTKGTPFVSISLWRISGQRMKRVATVGSAPFLVAGSNEARAFFTDSLQSSELHVLGPLGQSVLHLGYGVSAPGHRSDYVVYAESMLARPRSSHVERNSAFADLNYALYLGNSPSSRLLLQTTVSQLPLQGKTASVTVPFGTSAFTLVATPTGPLAGWLSANLPWLIALLGTLFAIGAAMMTTRLVQRRVFAEAVATENRQLYAEQRGVALTLQHALLPEALPRRADADIAVRYLPGTSGVEIGGDWYDVIERDGEVLIVVGDVSGRGLRAATIMASLRFSLRAYAALDDDPASLLTKLSDLVDLARDGYFATVLCARIDITAHQITFCNAAHPLPLMVTGATATLVESPIGPPIGVATSRAYESITVDVPPRSTFLATTDGLIERVGESIDVGRERFRASAAVHGEEPLAQLLDSILSDLLSAGPVDDVALMGLRWRN